ncbi:MAG: glycosyltransferase [Armatimonadota bacterium]
MRIFIGLTEISGYYSTLWKGFRDLGIECVYVNLSNHPFKYGEGDIPNILVKSVKYVVRRRASTPRSNLLLRAWWKGLQLVLKIALFPWAVIKYDVFIFGFNSSFLSFYDLPILRMLKKRIIYVFHGSDARPSYIDGSDMATVRGLTIDDCIKLTQKKKTIIERIERYADVIISHPPYSHLFTKPFVLFLQVGIPCNTTNNSYRFKSAPSDRHMVRILHSPSLPEAKGTAMIREAVRRLQDKGYHIELVEITGKPNSVVLDELARCDFVIDQLYSDTPMAGFAAEAAFFGKPAVVGGYARDEIWRVLPADKTPPVHYCHPDKIEEAIEKLIVDENYRAELGKRAKEFVETNWTPRKIAERYLQLIAGRIPEEWLYDPKDIRYLHGSGLPEERVKELIRAVIEVGGKEALQLSDKPDLERMFVEFAYSETRHCQHSPVVEARTKDTSKL